MMLAKISNHTIRTDDHGCRVWDLRVGSVHHAPTFDHRLVRIGEEGKIDARLRRVVREIGRRVGADRPNLGIEFFKNTQVLLQLTELTTAEWSPQTAIEDQDLWTIDFRQRPAAAVGRRELEWWGLRPDLERWLPGRHHQCKASQGGEQ